MTIYLTKLDPAKNARRFYLVSVQNTFLGRWCVARAHGRLGRSCRPLSPIPCADEATAVALAEKLVQRKIRRGYRVV